MFIPSGGAVRSVIETIKNGQRQKGTEKSGCEAV